MVGGQMTYECEVTTAVNFVQRSNGANVFFFQAEDGIRDADVTGVQTCALPICKPRFRTNWRRSYWPGNFALGRRSKSRSEERRVGKSVDLGGRRIIKKKNRTEQRQKYETRG